MTLREAAKAAADDKAARDEEGRQRNIENGRDRLKSLIIKDKVLAALLPPSTEWEHRVLPESHVTAHQSIDNPYYRQAFFITSEDGVQIRLSFETTGHSGWSEQKQVLVGHHEDGTECWVSFGSLDNLHKKLEAGVPAPKEPTPPVQRPPSHYQQAIGLLVEANRSDLPNGMMEALIQQSQVHAMLAVVEGLGY